MRDTFYDTPEWRALSELAVARDGNRCTVGWLLGGACSGVLHSHHIIPRVERPDLELDLDNLGTACAGHHAVWESLRRAIIERRRPRVRPCTHRHPYPEGRIACERRRMREAGLTPELAAAG